MATTGDDGYYCITGIPAGTGYSLIAVKGSYMTVVGTYDVEALKKKAVKSKKIASGDIASVNNFIREREFYCSLSLFTRIGVLGDSYASGCSGESESATSAPAHYDLSWPAQLARRQGVTVDNYSQGGQSTRSFITNKNERGLAALEASPACGLYIFALERNDYNWEKNGHSGYLGNISDITEHSLGSYPDTFYGNYATIIERVKTHAPNAKLVMMVGDYRGSNTLGISFNNAMIEIANHFGIPYMEQLNDEYFDHSKNKYYWEKSAGGHPAPYAYSGMELAIERLFDRCVGENKEYFMYYVGVEEDT